MIERDWKKSLKAWYSPSAKEPEIVEVPERGYLMVDGVGDPDGEGFRLATEALYSVAYTLKFALKKTGLEFSVMPLEGLWGRPDGSQDRSTPRELWEWTLMIGQPDDVSAEQVDAAIAEVRKKKKALPTLGGIRYERLHEGLAAQVMHLGPYADEGPTIARLHAFVESRGYALRDRHHEIYLGDPRRSAPEKLKTILRHPVREGGRSSR